MTIIAGVTFRAAQPVGARCGFARITRDGRADNEWGWVDEIRPEMASLWDNTLDPKMTFAEHVDAKTKLKSLIQRAANGTLVVADDGDEARPIRRTIIELKPYIEGRRGAFGRPPRLMRLYFGEPDGLNRTLLGLHLATKGNGPAGVPEQSVAIDEAIARANRWAAA
jgi:hypothetical protein